MDGNLCSVEKGSSRWSRKSYHGKDTSKRYTLYTVHNHHTHLQPTPGQLSSLSLSPRSMCCSFPAPKKKPHEKKRKKNFWNWRPLPKHGVCPFVPSPPAWIFPSFLLSLSLCACVLSGFLFSFFLFSHQFYTSVESHWFGRTAVLSSRLRSVFPWHVWRSMIDLLRSFSVALFPCD